MNNKGFAISTMMYMILILGLTIVAIVIAMFNTRGNILNKLKTDVQNEINDTVDNDYVCVGINTSGIYTVGDKYNCSVSNTEEYDFYVISSDTNNVNLIMSESLTFDKGNYGNADDAVTDSKVAYITNTDYSVTNEYKPTTALKVLKKITDNWFYIDSRSDTTDSIDYTGYKARLLSYSDITNDNKEYIADTLTSTIYQDNIIYSVLSKEVNQEKLVTDEFKIVPVITMSKTKLKN